MKKLLLCLLLIGSFAYADDDDGKTGPTGPRGPQGSTGATGAQGVAGQNGLNGLTPSTPLITPMLDLALQVYGSRHVDADLATTFLFNQPSVTYMMGARIRFKPWHFNEDK
jgi:hypothetical protein